MKKILLTIFCALTAFCAMAQSERNYTEQYVATLNGEVQDPGEVKVTVVDNGNETINVSFRDFVIPVKIPNITSMDIPMTIPVPFNDIPTTAGEGGVTHFSKEGTFTPPLPEEYRTITINAGIIPINIDLTKYLKDLPYTMEGKLNDNRFYADLKFDVKFKALSILDVDLHYSFEIGSEDLKSYSKTYEELLLVTVNNETSTPQNASVLVEDNGNGTINFMLKNFYLVDGEDTMPIGTIYVKNITVTEGEDGVKSFAFDGPITIQDGDDEDVNMWMGPALGQIPIVLNGKMNNDRLFATINIELTALGQTIYVQLGSDFGTDTTIEDSKSYTEQLVAVVNGNSSLPQSTDVVVDFTSNGTIDVLLKDFSLQLAMFQIPLGDFPIKDIPAAKRTDGLTYFSHTTVFSIPVDQLPAELQFASDVFQNIPIKIDGKLSDTKFYGVLNMTVYGQEISVIIGTDDFSKVYTEPLVVTVNGETSDPQNANVTVINNGNGTINFVLKNFFLVSGSDSMPVGTIYVENIAVEEGEDGLKHFAYDGPITIQAGDKEGVDMWMGPALGEIPIVLNGKMNDESLFATIDIDMSSTLGQTIHVQLGTDSGSIIENGTVYTEPMYVTVDGTSSATKPTEVIVGDNGDGTIDFMLKDFSIQVQILGPVVRIPFGDLLIQNIPVTKGEDGLTYFDYEGTLSISNEQIPAEYQPYFELVNEVPITLNGKLNAAKFYGILGMTVLEKEVSAVIGTDAFSSLKVYTEQLVVSVNGQVSETKTTDVTIFKNDDGTLNFTLKNFTLPSPMGGTMYIGTIYIENVPITEEGQDGYTHYSFNDKVTIQAGDKPGVSSWMGPQLGQVPVKLEGNFNDEHLYASIDIQMTSFNQTIHLEVGTDNSSGHSGSGEEGKVYTEQLVVSVNGETSEPQTADVVVVDNADGTINFILKNFFLGSEDASLPVGTIYVENITVTQGEDGLKNFEFNGPITIQDGDMEGVDMWVGPSFGEIPIELKGKMNDEKLFATIDINLASFLQIVHVQLGTDDFFNSNMKTYTENFCVTVFGATTDPREAVINIYDKGNTVDFELKDFVLNVKDLKIPFGNLLLKDLEAYEGTDGKKYFSGERTISIPEEEMPEVLQAAIAAELFSNEFPITISGWFTDDKLYAVFDAEAKLPVPGLEEFTAHVEVGVETTTQGDLNGDGSVDIADAVTVLDFMASGDYDAAADLNSDGQIDIADFVSVLDIMAQQ